MVAMARLCRFEKGQTLFREGQQLPGVYIVGSGLIRVFKIASNGKEHVLHMVGPGAMFAEVAAIGGFNCPANAEAIAPSVCALLPLAPFRQLLEEDHAVCMQMMLGLTLWVRQLVESIEDVVLRDAVGRLARYLLDAKADADGTLELPTLKRYLASHLNLTSETLSRTLRLADAGLIELLDGNRLRPGLPRPPSKRGGRRPIEPLTMTPRDRVIRTLLHEPVDRAPRDLWIVPGVETHRGDELGEIQFRYPNGIALPEFKLPRALRARGTPGGAGDYTDAWGCVWSAGQRGDIPTLKHSPLADMAAIAGYRPPIELLESLNMAGVNRGCAATSRFILAWTQTRPLDRFRALRGPDAALSDLVRAPSLGWDWSRWCTNFPFARSRSGPPPTWTASHWKTTGDHKAI